MLIFTLFRLFPFVQAFCLIFFFIRPLKLHIAIKSVLAIILALASLKIYSFVLFGGTMMDPMMDRNTTIIVSSLYLSSIILFLFVILRGILNLIYKILRRELKASLIPGSSNLASICLLALALVLGTRGVTNGFSAPINTSYTVNLQNLPEAANNFKISLLADLHISQSATEQEIEELVQRVNDNHSDLVLIAGDFVDGDIGRLDHITKILFKLKAKYGVYAVSGNHEMYSGYNGWLKYFENGGFVFLENKGLVLKDSNGVELFNLAGLIDLSAQMHGFDKPDLNKALLNANNKLPVVLMNHQPKFAHDYKDEVDLMLSGHTHGGLVPILRNIVAMANNGLVAGFYDLGREKLIISRGTRIWAGAPFRLDNPAEIVEITLTKE